MTELNLQWAHLVEQVACVHRWVIQGYFPLIPAHRLSTVSPSKDWLCRKDLSDTCALMTGINKLVAGVATLGALNKAVQSASLHILWQLKPNLMPCFGLGHAQAAQIRCVLGPYQYNWVADRSFTCRRNLAATVISLESNYYPRLWGY